MPGREAAYPLRGAHCVSVVRNINKQCSALFIDVAVGEAGCYEVDYGLDPKGNELCVYNREVCPHTVDFDISFHAKCCGKYV